MCMISSYICSWCSCVSSCHCSHHQVPPRCHPGGGNILRIDPKRSSAKSSCWASTISAVRQCRDCTNMAEFRWWSQDMFGLLASPWQVWPNHAKPIQQLLVCRCWLLLYGVIVRGFSSMNGKWVFLLLFPIVTLLERQRRGHWLWQPPRTSECIPHFTMIILMSCHVTFQMFEHFHLTVLSTRTRKTLTSHCGD